jgi:hypothetical protein
MTMRKSSSRCSSRGRRRFRTFWTWLIYPALGRLAVHDAVNVALFLSLGGAFLLASAASAAAVSVAVSRCEIGARFYGFALFPAALAMGVVLVATVVWGLALRARAPALFSGDGGDPGHPHRRDVAGDRSRHGRARVRGERWDGARAARQARAPGPVSAAPAAFVLSRKRLHASEDLC